MPRVRLLVAAAGRYEVSTGELFDVTDEEFSRWGPAGVVALPGDEPEETTEVAEVEAPEAEVEADAVPEAEVAPVEKPAAKTPASQRRSRRKTSG